MKHLFVPLGALASFSGPAFAFGFPAVYLSCSHFAESRSKLGRTIGGGEASLIGRDLNDRKYAVSRL